MREQFELIDDECGKEAYHEIHKNLAEVKSNLKRQWRKDRPEEIEEMMNANGYKEVAKHAKKLGYDLLTVPC